MVDSVEDHVGIVLVLLFVRKISRLEGEKSGLESEECEDSLRCCCFVCVTLARILRDN